MRLGFIQTRGLGDIVIAAPIAQYLIELGHDVFWPIDHFFYSSVKSAFPDIEFIQLDAKLSQTNSKAYFLDEPLKHLQNIGCDRTICLYSYLSGLPIVNEALATSLKFDEYKYAISGVPFAKKWDLRIKRDLAREEMLYKTIKDDQPYVLVHNKGSNFERKLSVEESKVMRVVCIDERTENPFDWLTTIERAKEVHLIDSFFANIVEQLHLHKTAFLYLRSDVRFTPVFQNLLIRSG